MVKPDDTVSRVSYPAGSETLSMRRRSVYGTWEAPVGLWAKSCMSQRATREPRWGYAVSDGGGVGQGSSTEETYEQDSET